MLNVKVDDIPHQVFIVAEAGVNHNRDLSLARQLVDVAVEAGADAVKFQTSTAEKVISRYAPKAEYQLETTDATESQLEMIRRLELPREVHEPLKEYCHKCGIEFISTPFDLDSVDLLDQLGVLRFKIPSGEITNFPLLEHVARKGRPIILSTGMAYLGEVEQAVHVLQAAGCTDLTLLHCTSNYPADPVDVNLRAMVTMHQAFNLPVGYSDHTPDIEISVAAVALGAIVIEKHFTLDKTLPGPDHRASLEPQELKALVNAVRNVEKALGDGVKRPAASEQNTRQVVRKSLVAAHDLASDTVLRPEDLAVKRPGTGISPGQRDLLIGRKLARDVPIDALISWDDIK